jgi:hypothetical protein
MNTLKKKEDNKQDPEDIIVENILSSQEIDLADISNKELKIFTEKKIREADYLTEDWQAHYAVERILKKIKPDTGKAKKKGLAIASLVCAIIGGYASTMSIVAVICGHMALNRIKRDPNTYNGKGFAISGLVLGYIGLILAIITGVLTGIVKYELGL